jgi:transcriptional regulator with PAS, ATPase and Fis domain
MIEVFNLVETISDSDVNVLIEGESGTGKEMLARAIHRASLRRSRPFHVVNCAVFNENLLESELFGHCKGSFTGAISDKVGRFEQADKGTLFLDEIGELSKNLQVKLLRFLQSREFERVGEIRTRKVDVRIRAASNKDLRNLIEEGLFRDDLYYRLNVIPISLPPLRERKDDIPTLAEYFVNAYVKERGIPDLTITDEALLTMKDYHWPGNVRELENAILHAVTCCKNQRITVNDLPRSILKLNNIGTMRKPLQAPSSMSVEDAEKESILNALRECSFNRSKAAEKLGITRTTLWRKLKRHNLQ